MAQAGQQWRHGWIPLTAQAAKSKNHGRKPGRNSAISRLVAEAAEIHKKMQREDVARKAAQAEQKTPIQSAVKTTSKTAVPKPGKKAGVDSRGKQLRVGDEVKLTGGAHQGKVGHVVSGSGSKVKVRTSDGAEITDYNMNVRLLADHNVSKKADGAIRKAAGRPTSDGREAGDAEPPIATTQGDIRKAYAQVAPNPGAWVSIAKIRDRLNRSLGRAHVDRALKGMIHMPGVNIVPENNQKTLTSETRAGAVIIGDQEKHYLAID